ncbi:MAG: VWA domain-containing protein [Treponema sp.]|jgi:Ca-activated chloride channel family protein|nr:VWA domain-containing protein [Treponema sp.]
MNTALSFENPGFLFAFALFIPLILVELFRFRILKKRFSAAALKNRGAWRYYCSGFFFWLFLACLVIALAGPRWGSRVVAEYRRGLDVVFALDISRSMEIRDVPAFRSGIRGAEISRLERGLQIAGEAIAAVPGSRFAAAIGKGRGLLAVPLTGDTEAILAFLAGLESFSLTGRGTNLEALIDAAASAFETPFPTRRLMVLISDGEALSGSLAAALDRRREDDSILISLGIGSNAGSPVPPAAGSGDSPSLLSSRQEETLRYAAERTGGIYIDGNDHNAGGLLGDYLKLLTPETKSQGHRREPKPQRHLFVIAAILAFGASKLCMMEGRKKILSGVLLLFLCSCTPVRGKLLILEGNFFHLQGLYTSAVSSYLRALDYQEALPYAEYGLGTVYFSQDEGRAALERYAASEKYLETSPGGELRFRLFYNTGLILFGEENYEAAVKAFRTALEIDGSRIEAKRNLELSILALSRKKEAAGRKQGDGPPGEAEAALFEYLRLKEQNQWKSREWIEEESPLGPDY